MRTKRQLTGRAKTRYLRTLLRSSADLEAALRTADAEIAQVVVTRAAAEGRAIGALSRVAPPAKAAALLPLPAAMATTARAADEVKAAAAPAAKPAPFNPYAFSAMAVLMNEGRAALEMRLRQVTTREHIVQLAQAQSVRLDPKLTSNPKTSLPKLRSAFIAAVEQRVAHRKAVTG